MARLAMSEKAEKQVMATLATADRAKPPPMARAPASQRAEEQTVPEGFGLAANIEMEPINARLRADLDEISGRANSLLTHISIMSAVISVFLFYSQSQTDRGLFVMALFFELVGYILTALACLGAIGLQPVIEFEQAGSEREFRKLSHMSRSRSALYTLSYFSAFLLTAVFLITLVIDLDVMGIAQRLMSTISGKQ